MLAAVTGTLALATACGDGGGVGPNDPPVANFTQTCTGRACTFDDTSTDDNGVTSRTWDFGGDGTSSQENPSHTFSADGTFDVTLTVTDGGGETATKTTAVTVANAAPTANFTAACTGGSCAFTNTSTDGDGTVASQTWDFGDPASGAANTSSDVNGAHSYTVTATTQFTVTLTVTDNAGATATATRTVSISPPATLECPDGSSCTIDLTERSIVTITLTNRDCQFIGNKLEITAPILQTLFTDGCAEPVNTVYSINQGNPFDANTSIEARFTQGTPGTPPPTPPVAPQIRVTGTHPDWKLEIDDGGTGPGEPDFNDIVLTVHAEAAP